MALVNTLSNPSRTVDNSLPSTQQSEVRDEVVTLTADMNYSDMLSILAPRSVRFFVTPELSESRSVNYMEISEMRQAGGLLIYIGTQARTYNINARFVSRTSEEADISWRYTQLLRSWAMPDKHAKSGGGSNTTRTGGNENAPEVVRLYGYGRERQLRGVPMVLTSLNIEFPSNISYIRTTNGKAQVPIVQTISIGLKEARNMDELRNFSLADYKSGTLQSW